MSPPPTVAKMTQEQIKESCDNIVLATEEIQKLFKDKNIIPQNARLIMASVEPTDAPMGLGKGHQGIEVRIAFASLLNKDDQQ